MNFWNLCFWGIVFLLAFKWFCGDDDLRNDDVNFVVFLSFLMGVSVLVLWVWGLTVTLG